MFSRVLSPWMMLQSRHRILRVLQNGRQQTRISRLGRLLTGVADGVPTHVLIEKCLRRREVVLLGVLQENPFGRVLVLERRDAAAEHDGDRRHSLRRSKAGKGCPQNLLGNVIRHLSLARVVSDLSRILLLLEPDHLVLEEGRLVLVLKRRQGLV